LKEVSMSRSKVVTQRPEGHIEQSSVRSEDLNKTINTLRKEIANYQAAEAASIEALAAYNAALQIKEDFIAPKAAAPTKAYGRAIVSWLDKVEFSNGDEECRRASITIPEDWDKPIFFVKGDEQLGHVTCDEARIVKDIAWVEKNPQCLVMLLGDAIDAATDRSPGSLRENKVAPIKQATQYIQMHQSIRDRIVGYVGGNHERRIDKALSEGGAGVRLIADGLSTPDHRIPFSSGILLLDAYWRGHLWTFTLFHGAGAAATAGSKVQRLQRNLMLTDSLITLSGHLHDEMKTSRRFVTRYKNGVKITKQTALQCGSYLGYMGSYGEVAGMSPTGPDMIVIELLADGRYIDRFKGESDS
jgi:hypothetical protein